MVNIPKLPWQKKSEPTLWETATITPPEDKLTPLGSAVYDVSQKIKELAKSGDKRIFRKRVDGKRVTGIVIELDDGRNDQPVTTEVLCDKTGDLFITRLASNSLTKVIATKEGFLTDAMDGDAIPDEKKITQQLGMVNAEIGGHLRAAETRSSQKPKLPWRDRIDVDALMIYGTGGLLASAVVFMGSAVVSSAVYAGDQTAKREGMNTSDFDLPNDTNEPPVIAQITENEMDMIPDLLPGDGMEGYSPTRPAKARLEAAGKYATKACHILALGGLDPDSVSVVVASDDPDIVGMPLDISFVGDNVNICVQPDDVSRILGDGELVAAQVVPIPKG